MFEGQSRLITCDIPLPDSLVEPSEVGQITASVKYTYLKQAGETNIEVQNRGG
jgi:hypothetical protein